MDGLTSSVPLSRVCDLACGRLQLDHTCAQVDSLIRDKESANPHVVLGGYPVFSCCAFGAIDRESSRSISLDLFDRDPKTKRHGVLLTAEGRPETLPFDPTAKPLTAVLASCQSVTEPYVRSNCVPAENVRSKLIVPEVIRYITGVQLPRERGRVEVECHSAVAPKT